MTVENIALGVRTVYKMALKDNDRVIALKVSNTVYEIINARDPLQKTHIGVFWDIVDYMKESVAGYTLSHLSMIGSKDAYSQVYIPNMFGPI